MALFLFLAFVAGASLTCLILEIPQFLGVSFMQLLKEDLGRLRKHMVGSEVIRFGLF